MNGVDLVLGLLALAALAMFVRWCAWQMPSRRRSDGLSEMGRAVEAVRVAHDELDDRSSMRASKGRTRFFRTDEQKT